jgi:hypothetical protein
VKKYPAAKYRISFANITEIADIVFAISIFGQRKVLFPK